ncbi:MAG TPA: hypothetical protein VK506_05180 [Conexibacter sp.]|nr:hypothetical protein [Conexibacter sp.]
MRKTMVSTALATVVLLALASTASALTSYTFDPGGSISQVSNGRISFEAEGITVECALTLSGTISAGAIRAGSGGETIGNVTRIAASSCNGGQLRTALELPWLIGGRTYLETGGPNKLPSAADPDELTGVLIRTELVVLFSEVLGFVECLYAGLLEELAPMTKIIASPPAYTLGALVLLPGNVMTRFSGILCPDEGIVRGSFALTPRQTLAVT